VPPLSGFDGWVLQGQEKVLQGQEGHTLGLRAKENEADEKT
jgi:hypothetical protein